MGCCSEFWYTRCLRSGERAVVETENAGSRQSEKAAVVKPRWREYLHEMQLMGVVVPTTDLGDVG